MNIELPQLPRQKHQWVLNVLARSGLYLGESKQGVYQFLLRDRLQELLGKEQVCFTFFKNLTEEGVDLAAPGSWFHDQLLRYSEEWGSTTHLFLEPKGTFHQNALLAKHGKPEGKELKGRRYQVLLRFSFRAVFYTAPLIQELLNFVYDPVRGKTYKRAFGKEFLEAAKSEPAPGVGLGFLPNPDKAFGSVWKALSQDVEERVGRMQKEQASSYESSMSSLKRYYRQLIADEAGGPHGRAKNAEEAREKTELLKLEWQRRVNEETDQLKPQVGATLVALAGLHIPMEKWLLRGGQTVWLDPIRGALLKRAPRKAKSSQILK